MPHDFMGNSTFIQSEKIWPIRKDNRLLLHWFGSDERP